MAKKSSKKFALNWQALILILVGVLVFALSFIPAIRSSYTIVKENVTKINFYQVISKGFAENAQAEMVIMAICSLLNLITAGVAIVVGVLSMFGILSKQTNLIGLIVYLVMIISMITFIICFYVLQSKDGAMADVLTIIGSYVNLKVSTFAYFLLGTSLAGLAAHILVKKI